MPTPSAIFTVLAGIVLVIGGLWLGQNIDLLPNSASSNAPIYDELFKVLFSIGAILFIGMMGLVIYSLIRFRRKPGETGDGIPLEGNLPLEILWTAVPAVVILFIGLYSYDIYDRMGGMTSLSNQGHDHSIIKSNERIWGGVGISPNQLGNSSEMKPLAIEVTAMQFAFLFHYPEGDILTGELHVPTGKPVSLKMESNDVIHAFWVPEFRLKQDVIPGQTTILNFTPTKTGKYPVICAELCGPYHGGMRSTVVVEEPEAFDSWLTKNAKPIASET